MERYQDCNTVQLVHNNYLLAQLQKYQFFSEKLFQMIMVVIKYKVNFGFKINKIKKYLIFIQRYYKNMF